MLKTMVIIIASPETSHRRMYQVGTLSSMIIFVKKGIECGIWKTAADQVER